MRRGIALPSAPRCPMLVLAAFAAATAGAQPSPSTPPPRPTPPMAQPAAPAVFPIRGFQLEGENPIGEAAAQRVLAPFIRPDATLQTLPAPARDPEDDGVARRHEASAVARLHRPRREPPLPGLEQSAQVPQRGIALEQPGTETRPVDGSLLRHGSPSSSSGSSFERLPTRMRRAGSPASRPGRVRPTTPRGCSPA